jgi:SPP1 family predicted phage head-tail adaptor
MSIRANVDARRLDQRVTFQRNTPAQDGAGQPVESWATVIETWASVDGAKASELTAADAVRSRMGYVVWVRADIITRFSITQADRVSWNGKYLNIIELPDQQLRGRLMAVVCDSGLNNG